ncbi:PE-PPE domain-containing protein [Mycobacterium sp. IS-1264]|uniref:PE family protein n=1 Tax=Mycobacterium sp. IS-1264 TaxID=1834158 RepID=UPI00096CB8FD|nr:PE-PPE domain-containing protein [Mycobacterium sp. IS-1264]OMC43797.1 PE family protein [Mycobacterium sp. IS-1264]
MSYVVTTPEMLAAAATDVGNIGSAISTASSNAAGPTTGLIPAAEDEVSMAIAKLFGAYGQEYQALVSQASAFHDEFTQALAASGNAYAEADAANSALMLGPANPLNTIASPIQMLFGQPALTGGSSGASAMTSMASMSRAASADPLIALIMGGTGNPTPNPAYVTSIFNSYIQPNPLFAGATPQGLFTPEQFWPITPNLGNLTYGQSVAQGTGLLNDALVGPSGVLTQGNSAVVVGYSQSAAIANNEINALMAAGSPYQDQLSFMLLANPNTPDGGILSRFPGFYLPFLDVPFNGATPPLSPYLTSMYTIQYDGIANAPQYPLNLVSDANAVAGYFTLHSTYPTLSAAQVANAVALPTSPGYTGATQYYELLTQNLPLLQPIRDIPFLGNPLADLVQPDLRVLVDLGYGSYGPGLNYANIPTPAGLFEVVNPFTTGPDLLLGAVQGPQSALVDLGLLPQSATPTIYPYVPSIDPNLNFFLGQPSVTGLSLLSGAAGDVLHLIPPIH